MNGRHAQLSADLLQGKIYDHKMIKRLVSYLAPYKYLLALSFFLLILIAAAELALPLIIKTAVDEHIVPNRNIVEFVDEASFNEFVSANKKKRFNPYIYEGRRYVVFPTDNRMYLDKGLLDRYTESGILTDENYFLITNNEENRDILADKEYYTLSDEMLAISESNIDVLEKEEASTLRDHSKRMVFFYGILFFILIVVRMVLNFYQVYVTQYAAQSAMYSLREETFAHLEKMPLSFFDRNPVGRLVTRVTTDIKALDELLSQGLIQMLQDVLVLIGIVVIMLVLNWKLTIFSFIVVPFVYILVRYFNKKTRVIYREVRKRIAMLNASLAEDISGIRIIQLFNQYSLKAKQFAEINQAYYEASMDQLKLFARFRPLINVSRHIAVAIVLWYGGGQILKGFLTLGMLMAFFRYMERFFEPINNLSERLNVLQAAMSGAERVFDLMDRDPQDYRTELTNDVKFKGDIEFDNVWLTYNTHAEGEANGEKLIANDNGDYEVTIEALEKEKRQYQDGYQEDDFVLKEISFKIKQGEKVALVGHTGSGKTSIINLISGMYPFQRGHIKIDGKCLDEYSLQDIRSNIGVVQQDVFLFSGTIRDNIVLNNPDISDEKVARIGKYVNVDRFVSNFAKGYYEPVMERGATFSVGQRQLIAFARVLAYNPSIFILDEATSNIDTETEHLIQDALKKVMEDRTSIIIAHRLSTIQNVDRIIVLHKGRIVEEGHHNELIANKNLYYDLYRLQYT